MLRAEGVRILVGRRENSIGVHWNLRLHYHNRIEAEGLGGKGEVSRFSPTH
jgi:hypothetical protein